MYGNAIYNVMNLCYVKIIRITIIVGILVKPIIARVFVYNCVSYLFIYLLKLEIQTALLRVASVHSR